MRMGAERLELSVLDFVARVDDTLHLAQWVEQLGYHRYWIAEHAPQPNPILIAALLAARTRRIRIGTGGILLHSYSPARAAYDFQLLEAMYPGRVDAGFCAGWFPDRLREDYLDGRDERIVREPNTYRQKVLRFLGHLRAGPGVDTEGTAWPGRPPEPPAAWCLGTGLRSAALAAESGVSFGYSLFHHFSQDDISCVKHYRAAFQSAGSSDAPHAVVAVAVSCAETDEEAERLVEHYGNAFIRPTAVGSPERCWDRLLSIADLYGVSELVVLDMGRSLHARSRCYELLAEAKNNA
jgi:luciferase family oxidoreductase group 1